RGVALCGPRGERLRPRTPHRPHGTPRASRTEVLAPRSRARGRAARDHVGAPGAGGGSALHRMDSSRAPPPPGLRGNAHRQAREVHSPRTTASHVVSASSARVTVGGVSISNPDRIVYPELGLTKLDVARHFHAVAKRMLPHVGNRPLSLLRCPDGTAGTCF